MVTRLSIVAAMFFQVPKRYPLLTRLALMLSCLGTLAYGLFISAGLSARLAYGTAPIDLPAVAGRISGIHLIQIMLGLLFFLGCLLTLNVARRSLVQRTDLALSRSAVPEAGADLDENGGSDEIDRLALTLEKTTTSLRGQLADETRRLEKTTTSLRGQLADETRSANQARAQERFATRSLEFIYRTSLYLTEHSVSGSTLKSLLEDMSDSLQAQSCTLALLDVVTEGLNVPAVIGAPQPAQLLAQYDAQELIRNKGLKRTTHGTDGDIIELAVQVKDSADIYGVLIVEIRTDFLFESRQSRVVDTVAGLIALSLGNLLRNQRRRRLALMDERNAIAGELHDSLAQALAYMKIQVVRLQKELDRSCTQCGTRENFKITEVSAEIKTGLDSAYRHLRELLTAFRTNMPPGGLQQALREVVDELDARAGTDITLEYHLGTLALSVNEEFHVLQIVREALTNVVRHARARHSRVCLELRDNGEVQVLIEDDGRGALNEAIKDGHYGLSIMKDRASQLGGSFQLKAVNEQGEGTRALLCFKPRSRQD